MGWSSPSHSYSEFNPWLLTWCPPSPGANLQGTLRAPLAWPQANKNKTTKTWPSSTDRGWKNQDQSQNVWLEHLCGQPQHYLHYHSSCLSDLSKMMALFLRKKETEDLSMAFFEVWNFKFDRLQRPLFLLEGRKLASLDPKFRIQLLAQLSLELRLRQIMPCPHSPASLWPVQCQSLDSGSWTKLHGSL